MDKMIVVSIVVVVVFAVVQYFRMTGGGMVNPRPEEVGAEKPPAPPAPPLQFTGHNRYGKHIACLTVTDNREWYVSDAAITVHNSANDDKPVIAFGRTDRFGQLALNLHGRLWVRVNKPGTTIKDTVINVNHAGVYCIGPQTVKKAVRPLTDSEVKDVTPPAPLRTPFVYVCQCEERKKPIEERAWVIEHYLHNHSHFHGGYQRSDYSGLACLACQKRWRTKAKYVGSVPFASHEETHGEPDKASGSAGSQPVDPSEGDARLQETLPNVDVPADESPDDPPEDPT